MKALCFTFACVCAAGIGLSQAAAFANTTSTPSHKPDAALRPCLLGSDACGNVNRTPLTACRVTAKQAKSQAACAVDGMKLIGKLTV